MFQVLEDLDRDDGLPPNWDWNIPPPQPPQAQGVDPATATQQPPVGVPERERPTVRVQRLGREAGGLAGTQTRSIWPRIESLGQLMQMAMNFQIDST